MSEFQCYGTVLVVVIALVIAFRRRLLQIWGRLSFLWEGDPIPEWKLPKTLEAKILDKGLDPKELAKQTYVKVIKILKDKGLGGEEIEAILLEHINGNLGQAPLSELKSYEGMTERLLSDLESRGADSVAAAVAIAENHDDHHGIEPATSDKIKKAVSELRQAIFDRALERYEATKDEMDDEAEIATSERSFQWPGWLNWSKLRELKFWSWLRDSAAGRALGKIWNFGLNNTIRAEKFWILVFVLILLMIINPLNVRKILPDMPSFDLGIGGGDSAREADDDFAGGYETESETELGESVGQAPPVSRVTPEPTETSLTRKEFTRIQVGGFSSGDYARWFGREVGDEDLIRIVAVTTEVDNPKGAQYMDVHYPLVQTAALAIEHVGLTDMDVAACEWATLGKFDECVDLLLDVVDHEDDGFLGWWASPDALVFSQSLVDRKPELYNVMMALQAGYVTAMGGQVEEPLPAATPTPLPLPEVSQPSTPTTSPMGTTSGWGAGK